MTTEEMAEKIYEIVEGWQPASLAEIVHQVGEEARGEFDWCYPDRPNTVFWSGVSGIFIDAMKLLRERIEPYPSCFMVYAMDGEVLLDRRRREDPDEHSGTDVRNHRGDRRGEGTAWNY